jgi:hypothetical protein
MARHHVAAEVDCLPRLVPVQEDTCTPHAPAEVPAQMPAQEAEQDETDQQPVPERTSQSLRAEVAFHDWNESPEAERPLVRARIRHASALERVMKKHGVSKSRLALMLGLAERQVSKYLDGSKPIPTTIDDVLPDDMREEFVELRRDVDPVSAFYAGLEAIERAGAPPAVVLEGVRRLSTVKSPGDR